MLYDSRCKLVNQLLIEAAEEKQDLILFGSGVWFEALDRALVRALGTRTRGIRVSQVEPLLRVSFSNGGSIQVINLQTGQNCHMIENGKSRVPAKAYLVEDAHGVNAKVWTELVRPFLKTGECKVVYLGNNQDVESS